jgi:transposase-like protein
VSRICQRIREEFSAWRARDLSGVRLDYLFLDAKCFLGVVACVGW